MRYHSMALLAALALSACAQGTGGAPAASASSSPAGTKVIGVNGMEGEVDGTIRPGSKFSRVRIGMGSTEAESIIGKPNDTAGHITGKAFIPFYFGGDTSEVEAFYKGEGQLTYAHQSIGSTNLVLVRIIVDPSERGFAH